VQAELAEFAHGASFWTAANVGNFYAERSGQIDLMILLLHEDLANLFRHRVFSKRFTLPDAIAVIADGLVLVIEIVPEHVFRIFRCAYRLGSDHCRKKRQLRPFAVFAALVSEARSPCPQSLANCTLLPRWWKMRVHGRVASCSSKQL
jgi:hypothetical protein